KHLSGNTTPEEYQRLMTWLAEAPAHRRLFDEMEQVWDETDVPTLSRDDRERYWQGIQAAIAAPEPRRVRRPLWTRRVAAAAAVLILGIAGWYWFDQRPVQDGVQMAVLADRNDEQVVLPDSSRVWLRAGSTMTYEEQDGRRHVALTGEAYFEVTSDPQRPFTVSVGDAVATVLGTRFTLSEKADGQVELFVTEGLVAFTQADSADSIRVAARQLAVAQPGQRTPVRVPVLRHDVNRLSWVDQKLVFDHAPLSFVLADLERHFGVSFELDDPGLGSCELKADFDQATLEQVLETIAFSLNCKISQDNNVYRVAGTPCDNPTK
ncbi:MAG: FecR domain-containing protein, partial [Saprospiraceae bacterium]|nr:FecR domain-containing protein [Saprospiraceae bacterium]